MRMLYWPKDVENFQHFHFLFSNHIQQADHPFNFWLPQLYNSRLIMNGPVTMGPNNVKNPNICTKKLL